MGQPSEKYKKLKDKVQNQIPIYATYEGSDAIRTLCPHVLGYKKEKDSSEDQADEAVLCWQLEDEDNDTPAGWRCFHLTKLTIDEVNSPLPGDWETPPSYSKWQNGVQRPKYNVDYP